MTLELNTKLLELEKELAVRTRLHEERTQAVEALERELAELAHETDLLSKVETILQLIATKVLGQSTTTIDRLVTAGLRTVFQDQNLTFKTTTDKFRGKTSVRFELYEDGQTAPLTEAYGGGVLVVVGVLLRVTTIMLLNQRRMLLLDETLSHLSAEYIPAASKLLQKLASELGFSILLVTHQDEFTQAAGIHYRAERSKNGTVFRRVLTDLDRESFRGSAETKGVPGETQGEVSSTTESSVREKQGGTSQASESALRKEQGRVTPES